MQHYGKGFSKIYNLRWFGFARAVAPVLLSFFKDNLESTMDRSLLDIGCGTGQLAHFFLKNGFTVTGIDLSQEMLSYAKENNQRYLRENRATFLCLDAADFSLDQKHSFAVSTYDTLNHLADMAALQSCFSSVANALRRPGYFIFDLNTRNGLKRHWNGISVEDTEEMTIIQRGIFDQDKKRALTSISGFYKLKSGLYERFEETVYNTVFILEEVKQALHQEGFSQVYWTKQTDLKTAVAEPEELPRVFVVAKIEE